MIFIKVIYRVCDFFKLYGNVLDLSFLLYYNIFMSSMYFSCHIDRTYPCSDNFREGCTFSQLLRWTERVYAKYKCNVFKQFSQVLTHCSL